MTAIDKTRGTQSDGVFLAQQFGINLLFSGVMTLVMTAVIFHGRVAVPVWGMGNLAFDVMPSTLFPCIAAAFAISKVTGSAIRQGVIQPISAGLFARLPKNDLLAGLLLSLCLLAVLGTGFVAALAYGYGNQPVAYSAIVIAKLGYALILTLASTPILVARARACSSRNANDGLPQRD